MSYIRHRALGDLVSLHRSQEGNDKSPAAAHAKVQAFRATRAAMSRVSIDSTPTLCVVPKT